MNLYNEHLVAVDTGAPDARVVVCMPPKEPLTVEAALVFASHIIHKTNAALAERGAGPTTPRQLFDRIDTFCKASSKGASMGVTKDPAGRIVVEPRQFFRADEALTFAAALVATADPEANMLEYVGAVVEAARGGKALEQELNDPRAAAVSLTAPRKAVRLAEDPATIGANPAAINDTTTPPVLAEGDFPAEAETDAPKRKRGL